MSLPPRFPGLAGEALDPRVRAALQSSDASEPVTELSEEAREVLSAAVAELGSGGPVPGIAPVLGAGVLAKVLRDRHVPDSGAANEPAGSRIDTRR